jgi:hypothetical protein
MVFLNSLVILLNLLEAGLNLLAAVLILPGQRPEQNQGKEDLGTIHSEENARLRKAVEDDQKQHAQIGIARRLFLLNEIKALIAKIKISSNQYQKIDKTIGDQHIDEAVMAEPLQLSRHGGSEGVVKINIADFAKAEEKIVAAGS